MLNSASSTLKTVNNQASSLEARVVQAQMQSETKMAKQKAAFEEKLKIQEQSNQGVIWANGNISADIKVLKQGNSALRKQAHELGDSNKLMRSELKTLQSRLGVASAFTGKSLTSTDDSKSLLLQVLKKGHKQKHPVLVETKSKSQHDDEDDEDDDDEKSDKDDSDQSDDKDDDDEDDEEEKSTSFLAVSMKKARRGSDFESAMNDMESAAPDSQVGPAMPADTSGESPENLLAVLSKQVSALAAQEKESEKSLKNLFIRDYRAGAKRHQALLSQQKNLMATRSSLQALKVKLESAVQHLKATQTQLQGRLHGLGQYLQKLAHFVMAPPNEVPHLMEGLPKAVTVKDVTEGQ
jgi:hypothetical protein